MANDQENIPYRDPFVKSGLFPARGRCSDSRLNLWLETYGWSIGKFRALSSRNFSSLSVFNCVEYFPHPLDALRLLRDFLRELLKRGVELDHALGAFFRVYKRYGRKGVIEKFAKMASERRREQDACQALARCKSEGPLNRA